MTIPLAALPFPRVQVFTDLGVVAANHRLQFYAAGTTDPLDTYSDHLGLTPNANPVTLDDAGRATVYIQARGYKMAFLPPVGNDTPIYTQDNIFAPGWFAWSQIGLLLAEGERDVNSGYEVVAADLFVTVNSSGGADPCVITLPASGDRLQPVTIKNRGSIVLAVTPQAGETIDGVSGPYTVPVSATPLFPAITLLPDPESVGNWLILSSHGI